MLDERNGVMASNWLEVSTYQRDKCPDICTRNDCSKVCSHLRDCCVILDDTSDLNLIQEKTSNNCPNNCPRACYPLCEETCCNSIGLYQKPLIYNQAPLLVKPATLMKTTTTTLKNMNAVMEFYTSDDLCMPQCAPECCVSNNINKNYENRECPEDCNKKCRPQCTIACCSRK